SGAFQGYDFRDAYAPDVSLEGAGQSVGLVEFGGFYAEDISAYASSSNPPLPDDFTVQTVLLNGYDGNPTENGDVQGGTNDSGDDCSEVSLDIEMALAMAPQASVVSFETTFDDTMGDVLAAVADRPTCLQTSCSWLGGDMGNASAEISAMAAQGQALFCASGDNGAYGSSDVGGSIPNPQCLSPYVTAVGGTYLNPASGGGPTAPPLSYQSESTWNDFQGTCGDFSANDCAACYGGASGGGICSGGGNSDTVLALPGYQEGLATVANKGSSSYRNIPDISALADNFWVVWCDQCPAADDNGSAFQQAAAFDGTSGASPLWAAFLALANEQVASVDGGEHLGAPNTALYAVAEGSGYNADFHDVSDSSNNDIVSTSGADESCDPTYYSAVQGYDLATGWGSPKGQALIDALAGTVPTPTVSPTFTDSPTITETPVYQSSGKQGLTVLVPDPVRDGQPVTLYFGKDPVRTQWKVYNLVGQLVGQADISGSGPHQISTQRWASGIYFARIKVDYADGTSQTLLSKFAVLR
ncbi:MAG: T9SS type A sorting domain-containing protein, partial [bacterium]